MALQTRIDGWLPAPATASRPVFAIGDVHGRAELFAALRSTIVDIVARDGLRDALLVTLGDYVDRGPDGVAVLKQALDGVAHPRIESVCLPGNHEQFLVHFLESSGEERADVLRLWLRNGAGANARELGMSESMAIASPDAFASALTADLDARRLERLLLLANHHRLDRWLFVHAGIHPEFGLAALRRDWRRLPDTWRDEEQDPLWVRGPFLTYGGVHDEGVVVIHGHTPRDQPELAANRIGIDTGAYFSGCLTAVQLDGDRLRVIQAVAQ